jgi:hypothetical protein
MKINFKDGFVKALPALASVVTIGGMILTAISEKSTRTELKEDIKKEVLEDLNKQ